MQTLHERLRMLRQQAGLTLREVADKSGVTISQLSDVERGRTLPSLETLERIAGAYDLSIGELLVNVQIRPDAEA